MPRVTVYVPDDVKARMDAVGEAMNWSAVAQRAFTEAALTQMVRKEPLQMEHVVERLRASKARVAERDLEYGRRVGRKWASETAEYDELERVAKTDPICAGFAHPMSGLLRRLIDPEGDLNAIAGPLEDFWPTLGMIDTPSDDAVRGFIEGAAEIWGQVADKL